MRPDGDEPGARPVSVTSTTARSLPGALLLGDRKFLLSAAMALGLFAQIVLIGHFCSLLVTELGAQQTGLAIALVTVIAIAGRTLIGSLMHFIADRRMVACGGYAVQIAGSIVLILAAGTSVPLLLAGVVLFGAGFSSATSLPPLISKVDFDDADVPRVAALIAAIAKDGYTIALAFFGLNRAFRPPGARRRIG